MMEANKEQAERCLQLAQRFLAKKNIAKAIKFVDKSIRLHKLPGAVELRRQCLDAQSQESKRREEKQEANTRSATSSNNGQSRASSRAGNPGSSGNSSQDAECARIINADSYYDILGITRNASQKEIKKAYRKMALKYHPDKNKSAAASEAFKVISEAFTTLSDEEKKRDYDRFGRSGGSSRHEFHRQQQNGGGYEDVSPEDLFNMFFGGMPVRRRGRSPFYQATGRRDTGQQQEEVSPMMGIIRLLPLFLIFFLTFFNGGGMESPHQNLPFRLQRSTEFNRQFVTRRGLPYYVPSDLATEMKRAKRNKLKIESQVERHHISILQHSCNNQRMMQEQMKWKARNAWGRQKARMMQQVRDYQLTDCVKLEQMYFSSPGDVY